MSVISEVLYIANRYMGPPAKEYIERRCRISLGMNNPEDFKKEHLEALVRGIEMTAEVYMSKEKVAQFIQEILGVQ